MNSRFKWMILLSALFLSVFVDVIGLSGKAMADTQYKVHSGDTLWNIAEIYHTSVSKLVKQNHLHSDLLQVRQVLRIPHSIKSPSQQNTAQHPVSKVSKTAVYRVRSGDTLWEIALANHISVQQLMNTNNLNSDLIYPGQQIVLDDRNRVSKPSKTYLGKLHYVKGGPPAQFIPIYIAAGRKYGVSWTVLAAIHRVETNFSTGGLVSSEGAEGPMQFMPATFQYYGVTAPGQSGQPDINNVEDAIYTCARMLAANGFSRNPSSALYCYNHSGYYVQLVLSYARMYQELTYAS